ncbi:MAG: hypothetical protein GVY35_06495 [Bacteroidetes bacterium]|jgi:hypothetical protein|nr:hypothetical protein [Bacteroidota bacterium]
MADASSSIPPIRRSPDFEGTRDGAAAHWNATAWVPLPQRGRPMETKLQVLYSTTGLYLLFHCEDDTLHATLQADFVDLWTEDVVKVFLWPDDAFPAYFEYELSPLDYELPIIVPNNDGNFWGWRPWHYEGPGTTWRANFYRIDYEGGAMATWEWQPTDASFHTTEAFGTIRFD